MKVCVLLSGGMDSVTAFHAALREHEVVTLDCIKDHFKSALLLTAGEHAIYPDCRKSFMRAMATAMSEGTYARIQLLRPFIDLDKAGIAGLGAALGIDYAETWSCYKGGRLHCGVCGTCVERREAFILAGMPDPTTYELTPPLPAGPLKK